MIIKNVENVAAHIALHHDDDHLDNILDSLAYENSLLIFLTDRQGNILYSTDEHSYNYGKDRSQNNSISEKINPYRTPGETLNWQIGALRNLNLPQDYDAFLQQLAESGGIVGYRLGNNSTYVYGMILPSAEDTVLYISTALGAVGATVGILRMQLIWITTASLLLAFAIAFFIARRFSRPLSAISAQAKSMAEGNFKSRFEKGFCAELDQLSDTLSQTASALAQADCFRRGFLANISHDLRTPLTMIRGYAEMVRDISWDDEEQRETDLSIIIREADRLTGLVNEILEYSVLQSGLQEMEFANFDISAVAQDVITQFAPLCERDGYCMQVQIAPHLSVHGSGRQLARVLYNLIDNAISHDRENRKIQVLLKDKGPVVRFEVCDFGDGIPQDELPYIWDRYFTIKQQKRNKKGSGLGLAISKEILLAHNAEFGVESTEGQSSIFWFELRKPEADPASISKAF